MGTSGCLELQVEAVVVAIVWELDLQPPEQSVHIITEVVSSNPVHDEVYSIQHCDKVCQYLATGQYVLRILWFPPSI
jgi:hypothetical protein